MRAPDKVYIDDLAVVNGFITKISLKPLPYFSEYIRKDALLEWAKAVKDDPMIPMNIDKVIEKIESL